MNNQRQLELALKKQRLRYRCAEQRQALARELAPLATVFSVAEAIRGGVRWVGEHPAVATGLLVAVVVAKPRAALRWARRGWLVWQFWRKLRQMSAPPKP